jgi:trigger factor
MAKMVFYTSAYFGKTLRRIIRRTSMSYQTEKISGNQTRINFTVPAEIFDGAMQQAYLKQRGRINVPGFRRGKAPRKLIERMYGESVFYDEAFDLIFHDAYEEAVKKEDLFPVDQPDIKIDQIGSGQELRFSATVFVKPEVTLGKYKGLKGVRHIHPVPEEEIQHRIALDIEKVTVKEDVKDAPLKDGDTADIDFFGTLQGVPFEGGAGKGHQLKLGSNSFIPGFEEQLIGLKVGEEKTIKVTFPDGYHQESLAGREAEFFVKINMATAEVKPVLDDDFAQDVSEHQTFADYKAAILKELEDRRDQQAEAHLEDQLIQQAVDAADCDIPEAMVNRQTDRLTQNMKMQMLYQGIRMEDYLKYTNTTEEDLRTQFHVDALNGVKMDLVMEEIGKVEKIEPAQAEIDEEVKKRAAGTGSDLEKYREGLSESQLENLKALITTSKVVEFIKSHAEITLHEGEHEHIDAGEIISQVQDAVEEQKGTEEKKPAKKRAAKPAENKTAAKKASKKEPTQED